MLKKLNLGEREANIKLETVDSDKQFLFYHYKFHISYSNIYEFIRLLLIVFLFIYLFNICLDIINFIRCHGLMMEGKEQQRV